MKSALLLGRWPTAERAVLLFLAAIMLLGIMVSSGYAAPGDTTRVSVSASGDEANAGSRESFISADGRYVAFQSAASNLVANDTNGRHDIFVRDQETGSIERVSVDSSGEQADDYNEGSSISADGRYVAFESGAANLVDEDTNNHSDIFVRDRGDGTAANPPKTERVNVDSFGEQANGYSSKPSVSADGRYVVFLSWASNLVADDTNRDGDTFVHDRQTGKTERVSVNSLGEEGNSGNHFRHRGYYPSISADGRYVAFSSYATNLVEGDTNNSPDVFVRDRGDGTTANPPKTERVSVNSLGKQADCGDDYFSCREDGSSGSSISADGRYVAFHSSATNLVDNDTNYSPDVFVRDRQTGTTERVSVDSFGKQADLDESYDPSISADGRYVAYTSLASNLVADDTNDSADIFMRDRGDGTAANPPKTERVSVDSSNKQGNSYSYYPAISADGRYVSFGSNATNLVAGDTNRTLDVFVHERRKGATEQISDLKDHITTELASLPKGSQTSLLSKLNAALDAQKAGDKATACSSLEDFTSYVRAQSGKKIVEADANELIAEADRIKEVLNCS